MEEKREFKCVNRDGAVQEGFMLDRGDANIKRPAEWVEGAPVPSFWSGTAISGKVRIPVAAFRCVGCGYVMLFARKEA